MLREQLADELKSAMKSKDSCRVSTLRLILAALKDRDIAARVEGGATSNARRRFQSEPLARRLTHQDQRRWRRPRFNRAFDPKADVGRREIDATHGFPQCARVRSSAGIEGHGDERQLDIVVRLGNAVQAL